ncbi:MAG: S8 family serine peptidase [Candidatus Scalindua sp.]|nr:S8 family serine peptidase [Candidatus Scalindua sp.]
MKVNKFLSMVTLVGLFSCGQAYAGKLEEGQSHRKVINEHKPLNGSVANSKKKTLNGHEFTFVKFVDEEGNMSEVILDPKGNPVSEKVLPAVEKSLIGDSLTEILGRKPSDSEYVEDNELLNVTVALKEDEEEEIEEESRASGVVDIDDGFTISKINEVIVTEEEIKTLTNEKAKRLTSNAKRRKSKWSAKLKKLAERTGLEKHSVLKEAIEKGLPSFTIPLKKRSIKGFVKANKDLLDGVELYVEPQGEIAAAMRSTKVDPYAISYTGRQGDGIGIYMSETGCPDNGFITNYKRISGSRDWHNENVSAIIRGVSPESYLYCRGGYTLPSFYDLWLTPAANGTPNIYIQNHSWRQQTDTFYNTLDRDFDNCVYDGSQTIFVAAGNDVVNVTTPAKGLNVITVGNYNDSSNTINSSSCYRDPQTDNQKPEIVAPGTGIAAGGWTGTGTSMASPHAAGFAADLMSAYPSFRFRPYLVKAAMLAGASNTISGGADKVGTGGINFYRTYYNSNFFWWTGSNSDFSYFDARDINPFNGSIDVLVQLTAYRNTRIVLSWLNRGSYTYSHRSDAHPIGMDMDFKVYDPSGQYVGGSFSYDNPYEFLSFTPTVSGTYKISIRRYSNRDNNSKLRMGLAVDRS